ncbi:MAG: hypothetical protein M1438_06600 [Deltaproteobacteria bacterium]|nr:hypothetical protein [Deltaproteobacteria bacterium]
MSGTLSFREQQKFQKYARSLVRLPEPGEAPLDYLLPEGRWQELLNREPDPAAWLMALSQATGVYFFPSREWPGRLLRYLKLLEITRLLEAGAGRGYLTAALTPLCEEAGINFKAVDKGEGEFQSDLRPYSRVERGDVFTISQEFRPEVVLYAWPPPGQSLARICQADFLHYLILVGEAGGGATGDSFDWQILRHRESAALSRYGRGRTGVARHRVTIFYGGSK